VIENMNEEEALRYGLRLIDAAKKAWTVGGAESDEVPIWAASNAFLLSLSTISGRSIGELAAELNRDEKASDQTI